MTATGHIAPTDDQFAIVRAHWKWFLLIGVGLLLLGLLALSSVFFISIAAVFLLGVLLLVAGLAQAVSAFRAKPWRVTSFNLLIAFFYGAAGLVMIIAPVRSALSVTFVLAVLFLVVGTARAVSAFRQRPLPNWQWTLVHGLGALVLGVLILLAWPISGLILIGLFIGLELLFDGVAWIMTALGLHSSEPVDRQPPASA